MGDLISRQAAIDAVHDEFDGCLVWDESGEHTADEVERILDTLPSVQPEQRKGKWIHPYHYGLALPEHECSVCHEWEYADTESKFCPNCGADMRGDNDAAD